MPLEATPGMEETLLPLRAMPLPAAALMDKMVR